MPLGLKLLVEKVDGQATGMGNFGGCRAMLRHVHGSKVLHGNARRQGFISERGVTGV